MPGTDTDYRSFVSGSASEFPRALVAEGLASEVEIATFTYMDGGYEGDGAWITWPVLDHEWDRWNANEAFFEAEGAKLAEFQEAVRQEAAPFGADVNIGGDSAGMGPVFWSENAGARYDQTDSYAGSTGFSSEWTPNTTTDYNHYYYAPEPINGAHVFAGASPFGHEAFEKHRFEGEGAMDNHTRINTDDERNQLVIKRAVQEMMESGR